MGHDAQISNFERKMRLALHFGNIQGSLKHFSQVHLFDTVIANVVFI